MKRSFLVIVCILPLLQVTSAQKKPMPTGRLVNAGGHLLHIHIMGKGGPTVVMENGSGDFSFVWDLVQPQVSRFTRTVSYDRAGYAWSQPGPLPRTGHQIAWELHTALKNAGISPPYILVGQSFGGFLVRSFARYYPDDVAGLVLVDALNEDSRIVIGGKAVRIRDMANGRVANGPVTNMKHESSINDNLKLDTVLEYPLDHLPGQSQRLQIWAQSLGSYHAAQDSEMSWSPEDVADMYKMRGDPQYMLGDKPLIVLSRGNGGYGGRPDSAALENERLMLQEDLTHLSTNSKHILDAKSGHNIHIEDPAIVIEAIRQVYDAVKFKRRLQ